MKLFRILFFSFVVLIAGCASNPMHLASNQTLAKAKIDESQIVFIRSSFLGVVV